MRNAAATEERPSATEEAQREAALAAERQLDEEEALRQSASTEERRGDGEEAQREGTVKAPIVLTRRQTKELRRAVQLDLAAYRQGRQDTGRTEQFRKDVAKRDSPSARAGAADGRPLA